MRVVRILAALALVAVLGAGTASASPVIELALVIDASGSISDANYNLQRNAYASVLGLVVPTDSSVAIGVWEFGGNAVLVQAMTVMDSTTLANLIATMTALTRAGVDTGSTAIGNALTVAAAGFLNPAGSRQIIDVSTDGANNSGTNPVTIAANLVAGSVEQVNCLGVGAGANCGFIAGAGSFSVVANDFGDFQAALQTKLARELNPVPEPASMLLLGTGLIGLARLRKRRQ